MKLPNSEDGIVIATGAQNNIVGGTVAGARNIISGNTLYGIIITGSGTNGNVVEGNFIGTDVTGTKPIANNVSGVLISNGAQNNTVGGTTAAARNVISTNTLAGVQISDPATSHNTIIGNFIGTTAGGSAALGSGSYGVLIDNGAVNTTIGGVAAGAGNRIAFNQDDGVFVSGGTGNSVRGNAIFSNGVLGIDLSPHGITANDAGDGDTGPNNLQNFPVLSSVTVSGSNTIVTGSLNSIAGTTFLIDFYRNTAADPSGYGEGEAYLGSQSVVTNSSGNVSFSFSVAGTFSGQYITATATRASTLDTSEFDIAVRAPITATTFTISGRVADSSGSAIPNVSVTRSGSTTAVLTNSAGYFTFTNVPAGTYTITPSKSGYIFTPTSRTVTVSSANVGGQNFTGSTGYSLSGRISTSSGMQIPNVKVTRTGSTTSVLTNSAGYYTFTNVPSGTYTITPSLSGHTFTPTSKSVTINGANTSGQNFIGS
jgi:titin